jgi:hypothetical protein
MDKYIKYKLKYLKLKKLLIQQGGFTLKSGIYDFFVNKNEFDKMINELGYTYSNNNKAPSIKQINKYLTTFYKIKQKSNILEKNTELDKTLTYNYKENINKPTYEIFEYDIGPLITYIKSQNENINYVITIQVNKIFSNTFIINNLTNIDLSDKYDFYVSEYDFCCMTSHYNINYKTNTIIPSFNNIKKFFNLIGYYIKHFDNKLILCYDNNNCNLPKTILLKELNIDTNYYRLNDIYKTNRNHTDDRQLILNRLSNYLNKIKLLNNNECNKLTKIYDYVFTINTTTNIFINDNKYIIKECMIDKNSKYCMNIIK